MATPARCYLLVAHRRVAPDVLIQRLRDVVGGTVARCHVVVPTATHRWTWDEDEARRVAADRVVQLVAGLRAIGVEATGEVGDREVLDSVAGAGRGRRVDEIILVLPPTPLTQRMGVGPVRRIRRTCGVPVTHLVAPAIRRDHRPLHDIGPAPSWVARGLAVLTLLAQRHSTVMLRTALGIVFVWFGVLKVVGASPVGEIVARTLVVLPARPAIIVLGLVEIAIGISFLSGRAVRAALVIFLVQMCGTFLTLVLAPDLTFQHGNPLLLSTAGEFVVKNLVLISAGVVIVASLRRHPEE
jgi:uncharacterized membrane protein YkgB